MQEIREMGAPPLGWEDPLEKVTATHSSILARITPWIEEHQKYRSGVAGLSWRVSGR